MKVRAGLLVTCAALALGGALSPAGAAETKGKAAYAAAPAPPVETWWYDGFAEIGGRFYMNNPDKSQLGRFYRYEDLRPGVFGNFDFGAHRTGPDPLDLGFWGWNVGWDDQNLGMGISRPGTYYFTFDWDQTPHVYSKGARTTYSPLGGSVLSTPTYPYPPGPASNAFVAANSYMFDLGFRRDTASAAIRWTPDFNWDVTADYAHMHREGTQPGSMVTFTNNAPGGAPTRASIQLPKPVDDTTQNANVKAEYVGSSPWGKPFNVALAYGLSLYNDNIDSIIFKNPWTAANNITFPLLNRYGAWPDNEAHSLNVTSGVGLPLNSRYMGTFQYTWMRQNDPFLPSTINPAVAAATLTRNSLDGDARTILSNNVLHTNITPDLNSTLRYRYYDYHSGQSPIVVTGLFANPDTGNTAEPPTTAYPINFNKQNANAQIDYRPWRWLNVGAAYEWERWRHEYAEGVNVVTGQTGDFDAVTNENAVKVFGDAKWGWSTLRTSLRYGARRFDGDYIRTSNSSNAFRTLDLQDRDSTDFKGSWDINLTKTVTITPNGGVRHDDFPADGVNTIGLYKYDSWYVGSDLSWTINPMAVVYLSYIHDNGARGVYQRQTPSPLLLNTNDLNDTFIIGGRFTAIPEKLFFNLTYTYSKGTSQWESACGPGGCNTNPMPVFPDTHNTNQRIDANARYMLDPTWLRNGGFLATAKPYVNFRVIWEKNSNDSWQNIDQQLGWAVNPGDATIARAVFLGMPDPNYNVVVGMVSFGVKW